MSIQARRGLVRHSNLDYHSPRRTTWLSLPRGYSWATPGTRTVSSGLRTVPGILVTAAQVLAIKPTVVSLFTAFVIIARYPLQSNALPGRCIRSQALGADLGSLRALCAQSGTLTAFNFGKPLLQANKSILQVQQTGARIPCRA